MSNFSALATALLSNERAAASGAAANYPGFPLLRFPPAVNNADLEAAPRVERK